MPFHISILERKLNQFRFYHFFAIKRRDMSNFGSPRSFKKLLLTKAASETATILEVSETPGSGSSPPSVTDNSAVTAPTEWPTGYVHIEENEYTKRTRRMRREAKRSKSSSKRMVCDCSTSEQERAMGLVPCGADCLNRMLLIECGSRCPCGEHCTNRSFKRRAKAPIEPFRTLWKGWGIRTRQELKPDTFLVEYVGEVIDLREFKRRCERYSKQKNEHFYFMSLQNDMFLGLNFAFFIIYLSVIFI
jgi:hypothetical protein